MLQKGDVVTVVDEGLLFVGKQGEIVEIKTDNDPDGTICVRFLPDDKKVLLGFRAQDIDTIRFSENELRQDADWTPENKAVQLFGRRMWHTLWTLSVPFGAESECTYEGCIEKAMLRGMVNCWGTVQEVDLCEGHRDWHGKCADAFPAKRRAA